MINKGTNLYFAESDYSYMRCNPNPELYKDRTMVLCEQCVEKYLKHLLQLHFSEVNTTHNINYIYNKVSSAIPEITGHIDIINFLRLCYYDRNYENDSYYELSDEEFWSYYSKSIELIEILRGICLKGIDTSTTGVGSF